jgi:hypothetical protein
MPEPPGAFLTELCFIAVRRPLPGIPPPVAINSGSAKYPKLIFAFLLFQDRLSNRVQYHEPLQTILGILLGQYKQVIVLLPALSGHLFS